MAADLREIVERCPHLISPGTLAKAHLGRKFWLPKHLRYLDDRLCEVAHGPGEMRLAVNMPPQHGKSWLGTIFFSAWRLLLWPERRLILGAYEDDFAASFGSKVKAVVERFGPDLGIRLKKDTRSKNEWAIEGHEGGMVCKGRKGGVTGRAADDFLIDDMVKDAEDSLSAGVMDKIWDWYASVVFSRLGPDANVIAIGTRWSRRDHFGRIYEEARTTGERWAVVKFRAIAGDDDVLGRAPGEALWPERRPLHQLLLAKNSPTRARWFNANFQQEPDAEEGRLFHPAKWPRWQDLGGAYAVSRDGAARRIYPAESLTVIVTADWAFGEKSTSDYTAIGAFGLTPGRDLLVFEVVNRRLRPHEFAPELENVCRRWKPQVVAVEEGHPTFKYDCRRHAGIPDVRWLRPGGKDKLQRALPAASKGFDGHTDDGSGLKAGIVLPARDEPWQAAFVNQLASFSGIDDEHDDMVDMLSWACHVAQDYTPRQLGSEYSEPVLLTAPMQGRF